MSRIVEHDGETFFETDNGSLLPVVEVKYEDWCSSPTFERVEGGKGYRVYLPSHESLAYQ